MSGNAVKRDAVTRLLLGKIADGTLRPGAPVPSGAALARETGYAPVTCLAALPARAVPGRRRPRRPGGRPRGGRPCRARPAAAARERQHRPRRRDGHLARRHDDRRPAARLAGLTTGPGPGTREPPSPARVFSSCETRMPQQSRQTGNPLCCEIAMVVLPA